MPTLKKRSTCKDMSDVHRTIKGVIHRVIPYIFGHTCTSMQFQQKHGCDFVQPYKLKENSKNVLTYLYKYDIIVSSKGNTPHDKERKKEG